jgi:hypothetical protein
MRQNLLLPALNKAIGDFPQQTVVYHWTAKRRLRSEKCSPAVHSLWQSGAIGLRIDRECRVHKTSRYKIRVGGEVSVRAGSQGVVVSIVLLPDS